jgi:hypothetical protein
MPTRSLNRAAWVVRPFNFKVREMCQGRGIKRTEMRLNSIYSDDCLPTSTAWTDPKKTSLVCNLSSFLILGINCGRYVSKVCKRIIRSASINMVNLIFRPLSCLVKPSKPVGGKMFTPEKEADIPIVVHMPRDVTYTHTSSLDKVSKYASLGVVVKQFAQTLCGKIVSSHDVVPYKQLIGQRPVRVDSTDGPRHFITRACSWVAGITKCLQQSACRVVSARMPAHSRLFTPYGALTPFNAL